MSRWFRFYDGALDDPKVQGLPGDLFKIWVNLLCVAARNEGRLPADDLPFLMRMDPAILDQAIGALSDRGLIDETGDGLAPHNWDVRQFKSDVSNERVKRHRQRHGNGKSNVTKSENETPPETEQNRNRAEQSRAPATEIDNLEAKLRRASGQEHNSSWKLHDVSPILRLIDQGVSLERIIIPKLRAIAASKKAFKSWEYPVSIILEEMTKRSEVPKPQPEDDERWKTRLSHGRSRKIWAQADWGPPPGQPGCRVPAHLIQAGDGEGWQDWKPEAA
jgi:hypothetical protein